MRAPLTPSVLIVCGSWTTSSRSRILIGGSSEKKTLKLVAQYDDACNLFAYAGPEGGQQKLDILKAHCGALGRGYDTIERTTLDTATIGMGSTPAQMIERCQPMAAVGGSDRRSRL